MTDEKERIARMIGANPDTSEGKVAVMHVILGHHDPNDNQSVECACGWHGIIGECHMIRYRSDEESWQHLAGRGGWHWNCPTCGETVWKYYNVIS